MAGGWVFLNDSLGGADKALLTWALDHDPDNYAWIMIFSHDQPKSGDPGRPVETTVL
jgi:hypothetical protein